MAVRCDQCIVDLLGGARHASDKLINFLARAAEECGERDDLRAMIQREIKLIQDDHRLQNLCETVANMLGADPR